MDWNSGAAASASGIFINIFRVLWGKNAEKGKKMEVERSV